MKLSGFENHFAPFDGLMANTPSMSITVARFTNSIARAEYSVAELANNLNRPRLIIGADGSESPVRACAGIKAQSYDYQQLGLVGNFTCEKPHRETAFQWFRRDGVLALLPLPGHRVSMVWSVASERGRQLLELTAEELAAAKKYVTGAYAINNLHNSA